jgi:hypothetical protein
MNMDRSDRLLRDKGKDFKFEKTYQAGVIFDYEEYPSGKKIKLITAVDESKPREAALRISSYVGISIGASHTYATLSLSAPQILNCDTKKRFGIISSCFPKETWGLELELARPVTNKDIKYDKEQSQYDGLLYGRMRRGDYTMGFWSEKEAKDFAIKFFKKHFGAGWILVPQYWDEEGGRPIIAST